MSTLSDELAALGGLTIGQLADRYAALHGHAARTRHKTYLLRKVAWRLQARAEGGLSDRARRRAAELADDADVRVMPPKASSLRRLVSGSPVPGTVETLAELVVLPVPAAPPPSAAVDPRLPAVGTVLVRPYKGRSIRVAVLADGFEHNGERYRTLTAVAQKVTGSHLNGYRFFNLTAKAAAAKPAAAAEGRP
jgi:hypothetical protein